MEFTQLEFFQGVFSLIFVIITFLLALKIILKYFEKRDSDFILFSFAWIGMANPWIPDAITFLMIILTDSPLSPELYFIIGFAFLPALILCWLIVFANFVYEERKKIIIIIYIIISLIFEIGFFYLLFTDIEQVGVHTTPFQVSFGIFMIIYFLFIGILSLITGVMFSLRSLKLDDPEIKLRGKFLFVAFISFPIAVVIDSVLGSFDPIWIFFNRILLMLSGVLFYMGFILPDWAKKFFLK